MKSKAINATSLEEFKEQIELAKQESSSFNLCILFCSIKHSIEGIQQVCIQNEIDLFGCTSSGEITNGKFYISQTLSGLILSMPTDSYRVVGCDRLGEGSYDMAYRAGKNVENIFSKQAILLLAQGVGANADLIIQGMQKAIGKSTSLFGGLAGDDMALKRTFVFSNEANYSDGLMMLVLDNEKVELDGLATSGWEAIGVFHEVTEAENNVLLSIDNQPALDVFLKYFGSFDDANVGLDASANVSAQYPLQILRDDGTFVLRSPLFGDTTRRALVLAGGIKKGDKFRFSISPGFEVIDQTVKEFGALQKKAPDADALILFSCIGRLGAFGPLMEDEIRGIFEYWNKPMIGFFSYGEIGATKGAQCDFHNETCTLVSLKSIS